MAASERSIKPFWPLQNAAYRPPWSNSVHAWTSAAQIQAGAELQVLSLRPSSSPSRQAEKDFEFCACLNFSSWGVLFFPTLWRGRGREIWGSVHAWISAVKVQPCTELNFLLLWSSPQRWGEEDPKLHAACISAEKSKHEQSPQITPSL